MITIKQIFEKSKFYKKQKEALLMLELNAPVKKVDKTKASKKLNISLAIDISGSMASGVSRFNSFDSRRIVAQTNNPNLNQAIAQNIFNQPYDQSNPFNLPIMPFQETARQSFERPISKLEQAKRAAIKALDSMRNGDFISIVAFDDRVSIIVPAVEITASNRNEIKTKINSLQTRGSTNIFDGWHQSAIEVAKNLKKDSINRVIVLTDGQTNIGLTNTDQICTHVMTMKNSSISTSTFGIGEDFNEDLLQGMANSGDGNAYYIDSDNKLEQMFKDEFNGLSNLYGTDVKISLQLNDGVKVKEQLNGLVEQDGKYLVPNMISEGKNNVLFKFEIAIPKDSSVYSVGSIVLTYKDSEGIQQTITSSIEQEVVTKKAWEAIETNPEVKIQETLMNVANEKLKATRALDSGNLELARGIISGAMAAVGASGLSDSRLVAENSSLLNSLESSTTMSASAFRKDLAYQSYSTRSGKLDK